MAYYKFEAWRVSDDGKGRLGDAAAGLNLLSLIYAAGRQRLPAACGVFAGCGV